MFQFDELPFSQEDFSQLHLSILDRMKFKQNSKECQKDHQSAEVSQPSTLSEPREAPPPQPHQSMETHQSQSQETKAPPPQPHLSSLSHDSTIVPPPSPKAPPPQLSEPPGQDFSRNIRSFSGEPKVPGASDIQGMMESEEEWFPDSELPGMLLLHVGIF